MLQQASRLEGLFQASDPGLPSGLNRGVAKGPPLDLRWDGSLPVPAQVFLDPLGLFGRLREREARRRPKQAP
eukprot:7015126-Alexandrium_andersonii.AAC.1